MPTRVQPRLRNAVNLYGPAHDETDQSTTEHPTVENPISEKHRMTLAHPAERRAAIDAVHGSWVPRTLAQHLDVMVELFADQPFIITDDQTWTYREIQDWSVRLAGGLYEMGIRKGEHVVVVMANHPEFVALKFAIARLGATSVPANFLLRERELGYVIEQSDAVAVIAMDRFRDLDYVAMFDSMMPGWAKTGGGSAFPKVRDVIIFSADGTDRACRSLGDVETLGAQATAASVSSIVGPVDPSSFSDILYTSGTTGVSKGVLLRHDMILRAAYASAHSRAISPGHRCVFSLAMYHVFGYIECMLAVSFVGGAVVPHLVFDPAEILTAVARHQLDEMVAVPTMTFALLDEARANTYDLSTLTIMYSSGGAAPASIWDDINEVFDPEEVAMGYGQTETTAAATRYFPEDPDEMLTQSHGKFRSAGIAGDLAEYKAIDLVTGRDLPRGEQGELMVRGLMVTPGYYNKPEETAATIDEDGWLHTGDIGVVGVDDSVLLTGRVKESYRCGGEMVMPTEVEAVLSAFPGVAQAHVAGIPHDRMGEVGCAFVVASANSELTEEALVAHCKVELARFKVPAHVLFVAAEDLPLTVTARVQKFRLVEMAQQML